MSLEPSGPNVAYANPTPGGWGGARGILFSVLAYLALEWVSEVHDFKGLPVTAWNPGLGLLFAHMLHAPMAGGVSLFLGIALAEIFVIDTSLGSASILLLAALSALVYAGMANVAQRHGITPGIPRLRDVGLLLAAGAIGAALDALAISLLLMTIGSLSWDDLSTATFPLLIGDLIGIAVVAPLALRLARLGQTSSWRIRGDDLAILAAIGATTLVLLWAIMRGGPTAPSHLYVVFLPIIAAAIRFGLDGACAGVAGVQVTVIALSHAYGFDQDALTAVQSVMTVLAATALMTGAIVGERDAAAALTKAAREELLRREQQAIRADRLNLATAMTSALSHEINQPMTAARALARTAELRLEPENGPPDLDRLRDNINNVVRHIDRASDILARMRAFIMRGTPEKRQRDARAILADAMTLARPRAEQASVVIEITGTDAPHWLSCDEVQVEQVLLNLIGNAIEAGAGRIAVAIGDDPSGRVIFVVRDDGPGIAPDLAGQVFAPLVTEKPEGLGLGLSICQLIVEAHGGRIWLESSTPGATEFRFWLPPADAEDENAH